MVHFTNSKNKSTNIFKHITCYRVVPFQRLPVVLSIIFNIKLPPPPSCKLSCYQETLVLVKPQNTLHLKNAKQFLSPFLLVIKGILEMSCIKSSDLNLSTTESQLLRFGCRLLQNYLVCKACYEVRQINGNTTN